MSKVYKIPVVFQMVGHYNIHAGCVEEALEKLKTLPLPQDKFYIGDSLEIDYEGIRIFNEDHKEINYEVS